MLSPSEKTGKQRRISTFIASSLILPCLSYAILGDAPLIPLIATAFLLASILIKKSVPITTRTVIYSLTISLLIPVLLDLLYPVDGDRFFVPLPTEILFPFVITLGICIAFFTHSQAVITSIILLSLFSMTLQGTCVTDPTNVRLDPGLEILRNRYWVFGIFLSFQMMAVIPLLYYAQLPRRLIKDSMEFKHRFFIYGLSIALVIVVACILCITTVKVESLLEPVFSKLLGNYLQGHRSIVVFPSDATLNQKLADHVRENQEKVILRARSTSPPGYLRGQVYSSYHKGKWTTAPTIGAHSIPKLSGNPRLASTIFYRDTKDIQPQFSSYNKVDIYPTRFFYSDVLLASGNSKLFEIIGQDISMNLDGVLVPKSWERDGGYTIHGDNSLSSAYQKNAIDPKIKPLVYTDITDQILLNRLDKIGISIFGEDKSSSLAKIRKIEDYLQSHYEYELGIPTKAKMDPVLEFLEDTKKGHCELYATSTALLLRTQNIPTRYVTGFVCSEPHPLKDYWIARLGDCHAWVEAWVEESAEWVLVETTPPIGIPHQTTIQSNELTKFMERLILFSERFYAHIKRGYFAEFVISNLKKFWHSLLVMVVNRQWLVAWIIIFLMGIIFWRHLKTRSKSTSLEENPYSDFQKIITEIDSYLTRFGINRTESMTIGDLIKRVSRKRIHKSDELISMLGEYQTLRYCPTLPPRIKIKRFARHVSKQLSCNLNLIRLFRL